MRDDSLPLKVDFTIDFQQMLISAERYACGRRTYIVSDTVAYIEKFIPYLDYNVLSVMIRDLNEKKEMERRLPGKSFFGEETDRAAWMYLYKELLNEKERRNRGGFALGKSDEV